MTNAEFERRVRDRMDRLRERGEAERRLREDIAAENAEGWKAVRLGDLPPEDEPPPSVLEYAPGLFVFFAGQVNWLFGDSESGKTWIALLAVKEVLEAGRVALVIEYEMTLGKIAGRLLALGLDPALLDRCYALSPPSATSDARLDALVASLPEPPAVIVVDSVAQSLAQEGFDSNSARDVVDWVRMLLRWMLEVWPSACVLVIDHRPHEGNHATGSRQKLNTTDAMFAVQNRRPFSRQQVGHSEVSVVKDRGGHLDGLVFVFECGGDQPFAVRAPKAGEVRAGGGPSVRERVIGVVADFYADHTSDVMTFTELRTRVGGKGTLVREAVAELVEARILDETPKISVTPGVGFPWPEFT